MAGYVIVNVNITDPEEYQVYARQTLAIVEQYGGKFIVRGGSFEALEGEWPAKRVVVLEFPSVEQAHIWYNSPEYSAVKGIRQHAATTDLIIIHGA